MALNNHELTRDNCSSPHWQPRRKIKVKFHTWTNLLALHYTTWSLLLWVLECINTTLNTVLRNCILIDLLVTCNKNRHVISEVNVDIMWGIPLYMAIIITRQMLTLRRETVLGTGRSAVWNTVPCMTAEVFLWLAAPTVSYLWTYYSCEILYLGTFMKCISYSLFPFLVLRMFEIYTEYTRSYEFLAFLVGSIFFYVC